MKTSSKRHAFFDNLDAAISHDDSIWVPVKYFMEMHFCIAEVQTYYKEI